MVAYIYNKIGGFSTETVIILYVKYKLFINDILKFYFRSSYISFASSTPYKLPY